MLKKSGVILMSNHTITGLVHSLQLVYSFPLKQELLLKLDLRLICSFFHCEYLHHHFPIFCFP